MAPEVVTEPFAWADVVRPANHPNQARRRTLHLDRSSVRRALLLLDFPQPLPNFGPGAAVALRDTIDTCRKIGPVFRPVSRLGYLRLTRKEARETVVTIGKFNPFLGEQRPRNRKHQDRRNQRHQTHTVSPSWCKKAKRIRNSNSRLVWITLKLSARKGHSSNKSQLHKLSFMWPGSARQDGVDQFFIRVDSATTERSPRCSASRTGDDQMNEKEDDIAHPARSETSISPSIVLVDDEVQILFDAGCGSSTRAFGSGFSSTSPWAASRINSSKTGAIRTVRMHTISHCMDAGKGISEPR
jgi:hypothetical protein